MIPGMTAALDEKIELMIGLLKDSIVEYTKNKLKGATCHKVFLTGRAFMLQQFRDAVTRMLVVNGVIDTENDVFYRNDLTKSICTFGAMKVGEQSVVNKNSNMLGCPHLTEVTGTVPTASSKGLFSKLKSAVRKFRRVDEGIGAEMSFDFFYEGLELRNVRNAVFSLSGMDTLIGTGNEDDIKVYYVGDGYIWKHGGVCKRVDIVGTISKLDNNVCTRLVKESVFPFDIASFGLTNDPGKFKSDESKKTKPQDDATPVVMTLPIDKNENQGNIDDIDR